MYSELTDTFFEKHGRGLAQFPVVLTHTSIALPCRLIPQRLNTEGGELSPLRFNIGSHRRRSSRSWPAQVKRGKSSGLF